MARINSILPQQLSTNAADIIAKRLAKLTKRSAGSAAAQTPPAAMVTRKAAKATSTSLQQGQLATTTTLLTKPTRTRQSGSMPSIDVMQFFRERWQTSSVLREEGKHKLEKWQTAREASGVFARYEEAGNKVGMPEEVRVYHGGSGISGTIPEEEQHQRYGNYFVYKTEEYVDRIMNDLKAITRLEDVIERDKQAMITSEHPELWEQSIQNNKEWISHYEESIAKNLGTLQRWSGFYGVTDDAKQYLQEYTRDQHGNEQSFETLWAMYGVA